MMGKWVPEEPTEEMTQAAHDTRDCNSVFRIYEAMLAAAPSPWRPIGPGQRDGQKIIAIGRDDYGHGPWRLGIAYWYENLGPDGGFMGVPFISSCQPTHFLPTPDLPPPPNQNKKDG